MSFLNPFLLLGLAAIAVPLLIHLINFRKPKKVRFSTLAFFESLKTSALRRIRIKQWLLLALRVLAVLMLVLALARPFLPSEFGGTVEQNQSRAIGILIDNSPSMDQIDQHGPYIDQVKRIASQIIEQAGNDDRIFIEATNGSAMDLPAFSPRAAYAHLDEVEVLNAGNFTRENLSALQYRLEQAPQPAKQLFLLTDAQATQFSAYKERGKGDMETILQAVTVGEENQSNSNTAITRVELEGALMSSEQPVQLRVYVKNYGDSEVQNHFLSLEREGEIEGQHAVTLDPGQESEYLFEVMTDDIPVNRTLILEGDELTFDNRRYVTIHIPEKRRILLIQGEHDSRSGFRSFLNPMIDAAVSGSELLEVERRNWEEGLTGDPQGWDAVILDGVHEIPEYAIDELIQFIQQGGGVFFLPSADGNLRSYNRFLERTQAGRFTNLQGGYGSFQPIDQIAPIREGHPVLKDIFDKGEEEDLRINLPELYYYYHLETAASGGKYTILSSETDLPILMEQQFGSGRVMISSIGADPGWSNFPVKPLFAPLFYRTVLYLATEEAGGLSEHLLGEVFVYELSGNPEEVYLEVDGQQVVPDREVTHQGLQIVYEAQEWRPGRITVHADGEKDYVSVNQHAMESDFNPLTNRELEELLRPHFDRVTVRKVIGSESEVAEQMQRASFGQEIWYWFIIFAIFLLLTETLVARLYKAETIH
ncbi:MAG: VWA domain-containing protein [Balneolaceae bacterium]